MQPTLFSFHVAMFKLPVPYLLASLCINAPEKSAIFSHSVPWLVPPVSDMQQRTSATWVVLHLSTKITVNWELSLSSLLSCPPCPTWKFLLPKLTICVTAAHRCETLELFRMDWAIPELHVSALKVLLHISSHSCETLRCTPGFSEAQMEEYLGDSPTFCACTKSAEVRTCTLSGWPITTERAESEQAGAFFFLEGLKETGAFQTESEET